MVALCRKRQTKGERAKAGCGPGRGDLAGGRVHTSILAGWILLPRQKGNVCAPLPLPGVGEEAPRRGVRRGRLRPSRAPGAPGIGQSHRTYNVLQKQLDHLFSLAECASRGIEIDLRLGRVRTMEA